jgi:hypothetical protein
LRSTILRFDGESFDPTDLLALQASQPVFLTNHCCEHAHGDEDLLDSLGIAYGTWQGEFYPLTGEEAARNAEDAVDTGLGTFLTGYVVLFEGVKWFGPVLEASFQAAWNDHDPALPSRADCLASLEAHAEELREPVAALGGRLVLTTDACQGDRHCLQILLPAQGVCRWCPDPESFAALLTALAGPASALPALAAVAGGYGGDHFAFDLLTPGTGCHVASITRWDHGDRVGARDAGALAHAAQLRAAGPMLMACCTLFREFLSACGSQPENSGQRRDHVVADALQVLATIHTTILAGLNPDASPVIHQI